jgi:hypothetical protein
MAVHRIGVFVLLVCALSTTPFGSLEQGSPTAAHAVAGAKAASWAPPGPAKLRVLADAPGASESRLDEPSPPVRAPIRLAAASLSRAKGMAGRSSDPRDGPGPHLTYRATAPPTQHAS